MSDKMMLEPEVLTGLAFKKWKNKMYSLALSSPKQYYHLREAVLDSVQTEIVKDLYKIFYNALVHGTDKNGRVIEAAADSAKGLGAAQLVSSGEKVNYPTHLVNNISMSAVVSLEESINQIVDILVPQDLDKIASTKMTITGKAESINVPGIA